MVKKHKIIEIIIEELLNNDDFITKLQKKVDKKSNTKEDPPCRELRGDLEGFRNLFNKEMKDFNISLEGDCDMFSIIENIKKLFSKQKDISNEQLDKFHSLKNDFEQASKDYQNRINDLENSRSQVQQQYSRETQELRNKIKDKDFRYANEINNLKSQYESCLNNLNKQHATLQQENTKLEQEVNSIKNKMSDLLIVEKLFNDYRSCTNLKESLKGMVMYSDILAFIASFSSLNDLDNIWDFVNNNKDKLSTDEVKLLSKIFEVFVEFQNKKYQERKYGLLLANIGDNFKPTEQISTTFNTSGKIIENYFPGYGIVASDNDNYVIKKIKKFTIVRVG